jgi:acetyltransferase-like isoleucine patch superfamily enzyme
MDKEIEPYKSHGDGELDLSKIKSKGNNVVFEKGILIFHPENIVIGNNVYIGHNTILKGYYKNEIYISDNSWIGQSCFFHGGGGIRIGKNVGIGPCVKIITSYHKEEGINKPILLSSLEFKEVVIGDDSDIGVGSIILPGIVLGKGVQVGAGAVVTKSFPDYAVIAGVPAKIIKMRNKP